MEEIIKSRKPIGGNSMYLKPKYKSLIVIVVILFLINNLVLLSEAKDNSDIETLESATEYDYPPFSVTDQNKADGFSVDLLKAVVEEIGLAIDFKVDNWAVIKDELKNGELDVLPLVGYNEERDTYLDFTIPYITMYGNIFIRDEDIGIINSEIDLIDKTVIVMQGDNAQEYVAKNNLSNNLILVNTYVEGFELLSSGEYDALIAQSLVGEKIISDLQLNNITSVYIYTEKDRTKVKLRLSSFEQKFCFAVREGDSELLAQLNEGLAIVSANGTYDELYQKWFPFLINYKPSFMEVFQQVIIWLIPIIIILLIIMLLTVRKQVREKTAYIKEQAENIKYISYHDSLTDIYNRRFYEEEIQRIDSMENYPLTLIVSDLNGLKLVNDTLGHHIGDQMIKDASTILMKACRDKDIVSRWGGDEFVCILTNSDKTLVNETIEKIKNLSDDYSNIYGQLSLSIGYETKKEDGQSLAVIFEIAEENMYKDKVASSEGFRGNLVKTIIQTLFEKSPLDKEHSDRVSDLASQIAILMNLKPSVISDIKTIGLLHDVGKIIIPQDTLEKTTKLNNKEWLEIKQHPIIGYRILSATREFGHIDNGVLHHHERIDGRGYPNGIKGDEIPIESKVIAVADAFDAMTSFRTYKSSVLSERESAIELKKNINSQFDESIVKIFVCDLLKLDWDTL